MRPLPWQARFLQGLARPDVTTAALSVGRSNGKSWLAARLATDYLLGDRRDSEAVIVASSYTQAKVIFRYALAMVRDAGGDPGDRGEWWYRDSVTTALLRSRETGQAIRALGCDPKRAHGRVFGLALMDEPAQWPRGSRDAMLSAIDTGGGEGGWLADRGAWDSPGWRGSLVSTVVGRRGRLRPGSRRQAGRSEVPVADDQAGESELGPLARAPGGPSAATRPGEVGRCGARSV